MTHTSDFVMKSIILKHYISTFQSTTIYKMVYVFKTIRMKYFFFDKSEFDEKINFFFRGKKKQNSKHKQNTACRILRQRYYI